MTELEDRWRDLGEFIREQRRIGQLSLRKLSEMAGISNPYLSQIERGLRKPSAEILRQIAQALHISAETLYVRAGILEERDGVIDLVAEIRRDPLLNEEQKKTLVHIYEAFRAEQQAHVDAHLAALDLGADALSTLAGELISSTTAAADGAADPTQPAEPADRADPSDPSDPADPADPIDPADPGGAAEELADGAPVAGTTSGPARAAAPTAPASDPASDGSRAVRGGDDASAPEAALPQPGGSPGPSTSVGVARGNGSGAPRTGASAEGDPSLAR